MNYKVFKVDEEVISKVSEMLKEARYKNHYTNHGRAWGLTIQETLIKNLYLNKESINYKNNDVDFKGLKIEIKGELRPEKPQSYHEFSTTNFFQDVDFYLVGHLEGFRAKKDFVGLSETTIINKLLNKNVYVVGLISRKDFFEKARLFLRGQFDRDYEFKQDTYVVNYKSCVEDVEKFFNLKTKEEFVEKYDKEYAKRNQRSIKL